MDNVAFKAFVDEVTRRFKAGEDGWVAADEELYWYFLGVVPPIFRWNEGFACGEPYTHNSRGEGVYLCFRQLWGGKAEYEARYCTLAEVKAQR